MKQQINPRWQQMGLKIAHLENHRAHLRRIHQSALRALQEAAQEAQEKADQVQQEAETEERHLTDLRRQIDQTQAALDSLTLQERATARLLQDLYLDIPRRLRRAADLRDQCLQYPPFEQTLQFTDVTRQINDTHARLEAEREQARTNKTTTQNE